MKSSVYITVVVVVFCVNLVSCIFQQQLDWPPSSSQDDVVVAHESPGIVGDSAKLLGGEDYRPELTEALRRQGVLDQDMQVSNAVKEREKYRHYLEKKWMTISARTEQEEARGSKASKQEDAKQS